VGISWRDYREHDLRFHNVIWSLSGNTRARELLQSTHDAVILDPLFERYADMPGQQHRSMKEHRRIVEALSTGDPDVAAAAAAEHGESYTRELVSRLFGSDAGSGGEA
ncbi:FCD domain-containing protein, partial [Pseudactinotalea sp.]|uniref:FCD domain-containing protein n=1 Tax=Pseudactinotalea sp. TaxID=1926260 RepID=UPI003B3B1488